MIPLYQDQIALVHTLRQKVAKGCKSLLLQSPTGSGKTVMAADIINGAYRKDKICFFIVPRKELLRQTSNTLKEFGIYHSFIAAGMRCDMRAKIFVCSMQTLKNRLAIVPDLAIIDECHYSGTAIDQIVAKYKASGTVILGLSATPWKSSGKGLGCYFDDMVQGQSIRWLIDNKRLSQYRAFAPDRPDLSNIRIVAGDYNNKQLSERMTDDRVLIGSSVKHYKTHAAGKLGITFGVSIKHSQMLAQAYRDAGIPAMHMDGDTPEDERCRIAKAYARRELLQLCCAELLCFGYDLSSASGIKNVCIQAMTDCQPTLSLAKQCQKNGRFLRYDGEVHTLLDHAGNIGTEKDPKHGMPCSDREWTLADREKSVRGGDKTITVRQCSQCHFCHKPAPVCPNCEYEYPIDNRVIKEVDGELAELQIQIENKQKRQQNGRARTIADLQAIAKERGYKPGWVWKQAQLKGITK